MENMLKEESYFFALRIVELYKFLCEEKREYILSKQLLRSGTSICALIRESEYAQSRADFINKLSIAIKEANETDYWLLLLRDSGYIREQSYISVQKKIVEIIKLLTASIKTAKKNSTVKRS